MRGLKPFLLYKIIEQAETQQGWLDDNAANRLAVSKAESPDQWLLIRAQMLSEQAHFTSTLNAVRSTAVAANLLIWGICAVVGFLAGLSVLGSVNTPVNVLWVVLSLLGVPTLTLLIWVLAMLTGKRSSPHGGVLGRTVQKLLRRFTHAPHVELFWQAWHQTTSASGAQRWLFSMLTHGFWLLALSFSVLSMAIAFSVKHYVFLWETTWLNPQTFVQVASFLSAMPTHLNLTMPDASLIAQSGNTAVDGVEARTLWARWIIAVILVWGVLPRLLLFVLSAIRWHQTTAYLKPQTADTYAQACLTRLARVQARLEPEGSPGLPDTWRATAQPIDLTQTTADTVLLGIELPALPNWVNTPDAQGTHTFNTSSVCNWVSLGIIDDLASREAALHALMLRPPNKLLIICDAMQTPDRGTLRLIDNLQKFARHNHVLLMQGTQGTHADVWRKSLHKMGLSTIYALDQDATRWLNATP
jgi:hypothetical protein